MDDLSFCIGYIFGAVMVLIVVILNAMDDKYKFWRKWF